jgi:hypothetical protein
MSLPDIHLDTLQSDYPICILSLRLIKADLENTTSSPFGLDPRIHCNG